MDDASPGLVQGVSGGRSMDDKRIARCAALEVGSTFLAKSVVLGRV